MFLFTDFRLLFTFATALVLLIAVRYFFLGERFEQRLQFQPGIVFGSLLFGAGWALSGGCPGIVPLQVVHGYLPSLITVAGIIMGMYTYRWINYRFFQWKITSCGDV